MVDLIQVGNHEVMGLTEANYVAQRLHGKGNVLEIRGIAGTSVDNDIHAGIVQGFAKYPKIKLVGSVHGNWTETIAQPAETAELRTYYSDHSSMS